MLANNKQQYTPPLNKIRDNRLSNVEWKKFQIGDLFNAKRPVGRKEDDYEEGDTAFVASGGVNNGVTKFCKTQTGEKLDKGNCLTVSPVDGSCYYQPVDFLGRGGAGSSIIILYAKGFELNRFNGLFISKAISQTASSKYSYGRMASLDRIKKDKILLPSDSNGNPDFAFMSSFMQEVEKDILGATLKYFEDRTGQDRNRCGLENCQDICWKEYLIKDVADILSGRDIYERERIEGNTPYVTATALNNGIGYFVSNTNETLEADCLSVNRNGSVGYCFYHPYKALFGNDTRKLRPKHHNQYTSQFLALVISHQKEKYGYGYKMGTGRLMKQTIQLPALPNGSPDWDYMEACMKQIECDKILQYLRYISERVA